MLSFRRVERYVRYGHEQKMEAKVINEHDAVLYHEKEWLLSFDWKRMMGIYWICLTYRHV